MAESIEAGSQAAGRGRLPISHPAYSSMWRDHNVFNMYGIPSATFGPARFRPTLDDMVDAAAIYAFTAWKICNGPS
ncbi:5-nitroanthranilic acid aminohydrolase [compost metagenome]